jgi:hypothetical protein
MKWIKERDLLIAQTMAFVQSVAGKKATADARETMIRSTLIESTPVDAIAKVERPVETLQTETSQIATVRITRPSPARLSDVREEIRGRVAAFRAHQELFHRERDEYCNSVLTRVRASTGHASKALDDRLPKP